MSQTVSAWDKFLVLWNRFYKKFKILLILAIATFAFAIMGMLQGGSSLSQGGGAAAVVNGEVISVSEFRSTYSRMEQEMGGFLQKIENQDYRRQLTMNLKKQALDRLVSTELLVQMASHQGIYASDKEVLSYIVTIPWLQREGSFSHEVYEGFLKSNRMSAGDFESRVRRQTIITKTQGLFDKSLQDTSVETEMLATLMGTKAEIEFIKFISSDLKVKVSPAETQGYLKSHSVEIDKKYKENLSKYTTPEQVRARHILVKFNQQKKKSQVAAKVKIQKAIERLKSESFAVVAKDLSEDPGSASKGGDLGFFKRGQMVKAFEEVAFSLEKGKVSSIVESDFGYHIIKVEDKKDKYVKPLKEVELLVASDLLRASRLKGVEEQLGVVIASGKKAQISKALKLAGLKWETTGEFTLSQDQIPKLGDDERLIAAALKLKSKNTFSKIIKSRGKSYILRLKKLKFAKISEASKSTLPSKQGQVALNDWLVAERKLAKIKENTGLIRGR